MFGVSGLFRAGLIFGLISDGELYFKAADSNRADFEAKKSQPFTYETRGRKIATSYWRVPEDVIEDAGELTSWATKSYDVALKSRKAESTKPQRRRRGPVPTARHRR